MDAIVIGAGPAGLGTSLGLSKVCRRVYLVEKHPSLEPRGATFGLAPNGRKALQEISPEVCQNLEEVGIPFGDGGLLMVWWQMRDAIFRSVKGTANIQLFLGERMIQIRDESKNSPVVVEFESGLELQGDFVVGADGVHSSVREWLGRPPAIRTGSTVFRGSLQVTETSSPLLCGLLEQGLVPRSVNDKGIYFVVFNFHTKQPGRLAWVVSTTQDVSEENVTPMSLLRGVISDPEDEKMLEELFEFSDETSLKPFPPTSVMDFSDATLATMDGGWGGKGRVTLVGDAAHAMRPTDGQGGSQAFEDAVVLCRFLEKADDVSAALAEFEAARLPRVKRIHDDQRLRYEARMKGEKVEPPSKEFRDWIMAGV